MKKTATKHTLNNSINKELLNHLKNLTAAIDRFEQARNEESIKALKAMLETHENAKDYLKGLK